MNKEEIQSELQSLTGWEILEVESVPRLKKNYRFNNFEEALHFTNQVGTLAEKHDHHPAILTEWGSVTISWWTHTAHGVTQNDIKMAALVDELE